MPTGGSVRSSTRMTRSEGIRDGGSRSVGAAEGCNPDCGLHPFSALPPKILVNAVSHFRVWPVGEGEQTAKQSTEPPMNTKTLNTVLTALALSLAALRPCLAEAVETPAAPVSMESAWEAHLLANAPANVNPVDVTWDTSAAPKKIGFKTVVEVSQPRYTRQSFFPEKCNGALAQLREALVAANKPVEFQKQAIAPGTQLTLTGSFVRRLDGKFSAVVWGSELGSSQAFDAALPSENSPYALSLRDKIAEVRTKQAAEGVTEFIATVGKLSSLAADVTGNPDLKRASQVTDLLTGRGTNVLGGATAPAPTNGTPAAPPAQKVVEKGVEAARMISGLFKRN